MTDLIRVRWMANLARKTIVRKAVRQSRKRVSNRKIVPPTSSTHKIATTNRKPDAYVSSGAKELTLHATTQNPAFIPDSDMDFKQRVSSFEALGLRQDVLKALDSLKIHKPTVIQMVTIPKILERHHVLCAAQTGSGKTLAYLAPIVHHLREDEETHGIVARLYRPRACIVVPARELAVQVLKWMREDLDAPVDLVVATPGTLLKYRQKDRLFFSDLTHLVIDEADTMFDSSFKSVTMDLLQTIHVRECRPPPPTSLPIDTQVTIAGATLPEDLIVSTLKDILPHMSTCTSGLHRVLPHIQHKFIKMNQHEKADKLIQLLQKDARTPGRRTVVFCNSSSSCDWLSRYLEQHNVSCIRLHGNIPPAIRCERFEDFQRRACDILVCTDIASRGLDTSDVTHVINFEFPHTIVDYIHRVGRTGRVNQVTSQVTCRATSFVTHNRDARMTRAIEYASKKNVSLDLTSKNQVPE